MREQVPPCVHSSTPLSLRFDACIRVYGNFEGDQPACIGDRGYQRTMDGITSGWIIIVPTRETMILRTTWIVTSHVALIFDRDS